jgi:hypothetical protein
VTDDDGGNDKQVDGSSMARVVAAAGSGKREARLCHTQKFQILDCD